MNGITGASVLACPATRSRQDDSLLKTKVVRLPSRSIVSPLRSGSIWLWTISGRRGAFSRRTVLAFNLTMQMRIYEWPVWTVTP